jgi:acyl dehydratase
VDRRRTDSRARPAGTLRHEADESDRGGPTLHIPQFYFEDFVPGEKVQTAGVTLSEGEIIDFALRFDPQPFHLDVEAAKETIFGGLIASGFHTMALTFRLYVQTNALAAASLGSPGIDEVRWLRPVRPGDTLRAVIEVLDARPSASKPDRGIVSVRYTTFNQRDEPVMTMLSKQLIRRRPADRPPTS